MSIGKDGELLTVVVFGFIVSYTVAQRMPLVFYVDVQAKGDRPVHS